MPESASPMQPGATIIEIRPFRGGWQCFEGPGVQPSWTGEHAEEDAIAPIATLTGSPRYIFEFQNLRRNTERDAVRPAPSCNRLSCFLIGAAALGCFVGYNLWNT